MSRDALSFFSPRMDQRKIDGMACMNVPFGPSKMADGASGSLNRR
jgi:hypothetical protein